MHINNLNYYFMVLNNYGAIRAKYGDYLGALASFFDIINQNEIHDISLHFVSNAFTNIPHIYKLKGEKNEALFYAINELETIY